MTHLEPSPHYITKHNGDDSSKHCKRQSRPHPRIDTRYKVEGNKRTDKQYNETVSDLTRALMRIQRSKYTAVKLVFILTSNVYGRCLNCSFIE